MTKLQKLETENARLRAWIVKLRGKLRVSEAAQDTLAQEASRAVFAEQDNVNLKERLDFLESRWAEYASKSLLLRPMPDEEYAALIDPKE